MKGCNEEVYVVFLQAPGLMSDSTKSKDKTVKQLAIDFNMTRRQVHPRGQRTNLAFSPQEQDQQGAVGEEARAAAEQPREPRPGDAAIWGGDNRST